MRANDALLQEIESIDRHYRTKYEKLDVEIKFRNSELNQIIQKQPFDEDRALVILNKISVARSMIKLNNIKHHLEIEKELDSFQRMKFNEYFSP